MERFDFIPGLSEVPSTEAPSFRTQGETIKFRFKAMPSETLSRWDCVVKTSGGGGSLLWEEVDGSAVQPLNAGSGIFEITLPVSLTDYLHRGAYTLGLLQKYWVGGKAAEYRVMIPFNVVYDASSPNPFYEYVPPNTYPTFDTGTSQNQDNIV